MVGIVRKKEFVLFLILLFLSGCSSTKRENDVVIYTSVDQHYAEPVFFLFEKETGIHVRAVFDVEASKTVGLVNRLIAEKRNPKADLFWNSEFIQMGILESYGILAKYNSSKIDNCVNGVDGYWCSFGGRARVMIINKNKVLKSSLPESIEDLSDSKWPAEKIGMALPLFGTSATHAAMLWAQMGERDASAFFKKLKKRGVKFVHGNSVVRDYVSEGKLWFGVTDSDDACSAAARGAPIKIRFLNQKSDEMGTLVIPNTVALIKGGPNPDNGQKLMQYLLSHKIEQLLVKLGWFHIVNGRVVSNKCPLPSTVKMNKIAYKKIIENSVKSQIFLRKLLLR